MGSFCATSIVFGVGAGDSIFLFKLLKFSASNLSSVDSQVTMKETIQVGVDLMMGHHCHSFVLRSHLFQCLQVDIAYFSRMKLLCISIMHRNGTRNSRNLL